MLSESAFQYSKECLDTLYPIVKQQILYEAYTHIGIMLVILSLWGFFFLISKKIEPFFTDNSKFGYGFSFLCFNCVLMICFLFHMMHLQESITTILNPEYKLYDELHSLAVWNCERS